MTKPESALELLDAAEKSGLLTPQQAHAVSASNAWADDTSPIEAAKALIATRLVTVYQAKRLLKGKWRRLCIDGYKLLYPLGAGGMGIVYAALELETNWHVALKVLSDRYRNDIGMLTRIQLEAQAGMKLAHPNILRTWAIHRTEDAYGDLYYVVMELVKGVSLQELVALKGPLPASQAADIARQTAAGLEHAHQAGLIHRDVKPENLLVRTDGSVKVVDFGLAMIDENDEEFSMAMILGQDRLGTADYVAPEQALNSYRVDCRADIYSLGCTMYYALTGRPPFPVRSVPEKLRGHRCRKPRPISDTRDDVPEELLAIIDRMLAKQPADRFQSAAEVEAALAPFGQREPVEFDFAAVLERRVRIARRREAERRRREKEDTTLKGQSNTVIMPQQKERQEQADSVIQDQIQALQARSGDDGAADT